MFEACHQPRLLHAVRDLRSSGSQGLDRYSTTEEHVTSQVYFSFAALSDSVFDHIVTDRHADGE
jgi:hypothetical protein